MSKTVPFKLYFLFIYFIGFAVFFAAKIQYGKVFWFAYWFENNTC